MQRTAEAIVKRAGVILAAGIGVRMRSKLPKVLHQVCGAPMVQHVAEAVRGAGIDRLVVVASPPEYAREVPNDHRHIGVLIAQQAAANCQSLA